MPDDMKVLLRAELFEGLGVEVLEAVVRAATSRLILGGRALFLQGGEPTHLYLVAQGRLKISHTTGNGATLTIRFMGPGEVAGCVATFRRVPYPATATAVMDSRVLTWPAAQMGELMDRHPRITANALRMVSGRTEDMLGHLQEFAMEPVDRRIARVLLRLANQAGQSVEDGVEVAFPLSRQDIAEIAGTTLHTVSRTLSGWERQGLVAGGRQRVVIRDAKGLGEIGWGTRPSHLPDLV